MEIQHRDKLLAVFERAKAALKKKDVVELKLISDQAIDSASIFQDEVYLLTAVIIYALSKIHERTRYQKYSDYDGFCKDTEEEINRAYQELKRDNISGFERTLKDILTEIKRLEPVLRKYIEYVLEKSKIHKGSRIHEHGISVGRVCELLGISQFELNDYIGKTWIADVKESITMPIEKRINLARGMMK